MAVHGSVSTQEIIRSKEKRKPPRFDADDGTGSAQGCVQDQPDMREKGPREQYALALNFS